jgi:hypothetical protein
MILGPDGKPANAWYNPAEFERIFRELAIANSSVPFPFPRLTHILGPDGRSVYSDTPPQGSTIVVKTPKRYQQPPDPSVTLPSDE